MTDLVTFLRARVDEDEQVARAATPGPWAAHLGSELHEDAAAWIGAPGSATSDGLFVASVCNAPAGLDDAGHIARHDPVRVLRDVEAKRRILALHGLWHVCWTKHDWSPVDPDSASAGGEMPPCDTLRLLALPYSDHPDYDPAWRL